MVENSLLHRLADVAPGLPVFNYRPTARRKPDYEPVENTDEAQKKFGNVKAISSDMYFGRQAQADVSVQRVCVSPIEQEASRDLGARGGGDRRRVGGTQTVRGPWAQGDGVGTQTQVLLTPPPHCPSWRRG